MNIDEIRVPREERFEIYNDNNIVIVIPLSYRALTKYATYCQWCIIGDHIDWGEYYEGKSMLIIQRKGRPGGNRTAQKIFLLDKITRRDYSMEDLLDYEFETYDSLEDAARDLDKLSKDINNFDTNVVMYTLSDNIHSMWDSEDNELSQYGFSLSDLPNVSPEIAKIAFKGLKDFVSKSVNLVTESYKNRLQELAGIDIEKYPDMNSMIPKYKLRYPKKDIFIKVNINKLLGRHKKDDPSYAFDTKEKSDHPGRVDRAKEFWKSFSKDQRYINHNTGERTSWGITTFEAPYVSIDYGRLGFSDGRHRVIAMKELGYDDIIIEVPKSQVHLFDELK